MEGWPSSPRRMQLGSPRLNSLTDLMEGPEGSEQQVFSIKISKFQNILYFLQHICIINL